MTGKMTFSALMSAWDRGESIFVRFNAGNAAVWDLRVEDVDGNYEDYRGFNLNQISEIRINGGGKANYR